MATLDSLASRIPNDLEALLMDPSQQASYEQMLMDRVRGDIERQSGNEAQRINEAAFGRGMGLSTINAFAQAQNMRAREEALAKARVDANRATLDAARSALGQAAGYVNAQQQRQQQGSQFNRQLKHQQSMNTQNMIGQGVGGLAGGLAKVGMGIFGDDIKKGVRGMVGLGGNEQQPGGYMQRGAAPEAQMPSIEANSQAISMPEIAGSGLEDLYAGMADSGDYGIGDLGGYSIDPGDFDLGGDWGNTDLWQFMNDDWSF